MQQASHIHQQPAEAGIGFEVLVCQTGDGMATA
jgi:hypothetical protein